MTKHPRMRRFFGRVMRLAALVFALAWWASAKAGWMYFSPVGKYSEAAFNLRDGVWYFHYADAGQMKLAPATGWSVLSVNGSYGIRWPAAKSVPGGADVRIPAWCPFVASVFASLILFEATPRRRFAPDCCQKCGYNLRGTVSRVCTECETPVPSSALLITALPASAWSVYWRHWAGGTPTTRVKPPANLVSDKPMVMPHNRQSALMRAGTLQNRV